MKGRPLIGEVENLHIVCRVSLDRMILKIKPINTPYDPSSDMEIELWMNKLLPLIEVGDVLGMSGINRILVLKKGRI